MDKDTFFHNFHANLAEKYKTSYPNIRIIRERSINGSLNFNGVKNWLAERLATYQVNHKRPRQKYLECLDFLNSINQSQFDDIVQLTKFDKS